jgi:hypothetical protein
MKKGAKGETGKRVKGNGEREMGRKGDGEKLVNQLPLFPFTRFPPVVLPLHAAFFGSVDLGRLRNFAEEKTLDVIKQKVLRIGVGKIQAVMIDDLRLLLEPGTPTRLADLGRDSLSQFVGKRSEPQSRSLLSTMFAFD